MCQNHTVSLPDSLLTQENTFLRADVPGRDCRIILSGNPQNLQNLRPQLPCFGQDRDSRAVKEISRHIPGTQRVLCVPGRHPHDTASALHRIFNRIFGVGDGEKPEAPEFEAYRENELDMMVKIEGTNATGV